MLSFSNYLFHNESEAGSGRGTSIICQQPQCGKQMHGSSPGTAPLTHSPSAVTGVSCAASCTQHFNSSRQYISNIIYRLSASRRPKIVWETIGNWFIENKREQKSLFFAAAYCWSHATSLCITEILAKAKVLSWERNRCTHLHGSWAGTSQRNSLTSLRRPFPGCFRLTQSFIP